MLVKYIKFKSTKKDNNKTYITIKAIKLNNDIKYIYTCKHIEILVICHNCKAQSRTIINTSYPYKYLFIFIKFFKK